LLLIQLAEDKVKRIADMAQSQPGYELSIDLEEQLINDDQGLRESFVIDEFRRHRLLHGLDEIAMTLAHEAEIARYEEGRRAAIPG